ncbi:Fibrinogen-like coiled coil protein [uncultured Mediterranean phage uvMED]|nr:Fibrinogen-like coiled coil protein [uncultured Mediterranean phage uvMED]|tara:strand:- start:962 stop:1345 length:384 start_codon:yes stop_codon:yes gene_type:complete
MKEQPIALSDKTKLSMPIANLIGLVMIVASVVFMYSEITGRLTSLETSRELYDADLLKKSTQLPTDQEQYMLLEHLAKQVEGIQEELAENRNNNVNLNRAMKDIEKMQVVIEEMKDKIRNNGNGTHQ